MVIGPGGCRFGDNWRPGLPLLVLLALAALSSPECSGACGIRPAME